MAAKWPPVPTSDNGWPLETGDISGVGGLVVDSRGLEVRFVSFEWGGNGFMKNESKNQFQPQVPLFYDQSKNNFWLTNIFPRPKHS